MGRQSKVSIQQREDGGWYFGLCRSKENEKYYKFNVLNKRRIYKSPSYEALCNQIVLMMVPSAYALTDPWELMAETMAFLASEKKDLGFGVDSDIPSFFVPAKRFLNIQKYGLDK